MTDKSTFSEGLKSLKRIRMMMEYNPSKTLKENLEDVQPLKEAVAFVSDDEITNQTKEVGETSQQEKEYMDIFGGTVYIEPPFKFARYKEKKSAWDFIPYGQDVTLQQWCKSRMNNYEKFCPKKDPMVVGGIHNFNKDGYDWVPIFGNPWLEYVNEMQKEPEKIDYKMYEKYNQWYFSGYYNEEKRQYWSTKGKDKPYKKGSAAGTSGQETKIAKKNKKTSKTNSEVSLNYDVSDIDDVSRKLDAKMIFAVD